MRTKFGVILSIIIGGALLAFVLSLKTEMGFSNNDPKVGKINGETIKYSEFSNAYDEVKAQLGGEAYSDEQAMRLLQGTWQSIMADHVIAPGFEDMGIAVSDEERTAMLTGARESAVLSSLFTNPKTGQFDVEAVTAFLQQVQTSAQAQSAWKTINSQAILDRNINKYVNLVKLGANVSKLEVATSLAVADKSYNGRFVTAKYQSIPDSTITVSASEKKAYYNEHKKAYRQTPYRSLSYVVFPVDATAEDKAAIENEARTVAAEFLAVEDVRSFARDNRHVSVAQAYVPEDKLSDAEAKFLAAGKTYGPELVGDEWKASRVVSVRKVADKLTLQHIVLSYTDSDKADELMAKAKAGEDFGELARTNSMAETAENNGELGEVEYSSLAPEFASALQNAKVGDVVKIVFGNSIQIMKVTKLGTVKPHYQVASMVYPVEASQATKGNVHVAASKFAVNAKGSFEKFNTTASEQSVNPRTATIELGERQIRGIDGNSTEVVRWAVDAKVGDVSDIFNVDNAYVVAVLTAINDSEYKTVEEVDMQITSALKRDKKFEILAGKMQGATLEEVAAAVEGTVQNFEDAKFDGYYVNNIGVEPRILGLVTALEPGKLSAPVKGMSGAFVLVVDEVKTPEEAQTEEAEKVKLQSQAADMGSRRAMYAIQDMAEVKDYSVKYF